MPKSKKSHKQRLLPNNCRAGQPSVYPSNWNTAKAKAGCTWYICYWFYDDNLNQKLQVFIKGMNEFGMLAEKQAVTRKLLEDDRIELEVRGKNYITKQYSETENGELSEHTPLMQALEYALNNLEAEEHTKEDIKSNLRYLQMAALVLRYDYLSLADTKKRHLINLLNKTGEVKKKHVAELLASGKKVQHPEPWSNNNFNAYRKNLSTLFSALVDDYEVADVNLVNGIKKKKILKRIRETLTDEQFVIINKDLYDHHYSFWRFMALFYESSSRETEMMLVKRTDVDLTRQRFKVTVKKGSGDSEEQWRPIKDGVVELWKQVYHKATGSQYLFSESLEPGNVPISAAQITRRWKRHIKDVHGITADFYSLKHSHITAMMDLLTAQQEALQLVAGMAGHKSTRMVQTVYDVKSAERKNNTILKMPARFKQ